MLVWDEIETDGIVEMRRTAVPGGWLVLAGQSIVFVPDPSHDWDGGSVGPEAPEPK